MIDLMVWYIHIIHSKKRFDRKDQHRRRRIHLIRIIKYRIEYNHRPTDKKRFIVKVKWVTLNQSMWPSFLDFYYRVVQSLKWKRNKYTNFKNYEKFELTLKLSKKKKWIVIKLFLFSSLHVSFDWYFSFLLFCFPFDLSNHCIWQRTITKRNRYNTIQYNIINHQSYYITHW